jgi:hypothetical protein
VSLPAYRRSLAVPLDFLHVGWRSWSDVSCLKMMLEIRNPEMTKNTSTPMNPPGNYCGKA